MPDLELLSPAGLAGSTAVPPAPREQSLRGRVVGLIDNSKSGSRPFLDRIEELLRGECGVARVVRLEKRAAALPISDEQLETAVAECEVVVNGIAD